MYAIGIIAANVPWYIIALVPFQGYERINRKAAVVIILSVALLRALGAGLICAYVEDWKTWDTYFLLLYTCLQLGAYYLCFRIELSKLLYTLLMLIVLANTANFLANMIVRPFYPDPAIVIAAHPVWIGVVMIIIGCAFPFVYNAAKGLLRSAFAELPARSFRPLCVIPAVFYVISCIYVLTQGTSTTSNMLMSFLIVFSGALTSYTTLRMVTDTAKYARVEKELAAENAALDRVHRLKTDMMATISHELSTPLTVMIGFAQLIIMQQTQNNADKQLLSDLDKIVSEAKRLSRFVDETQRVASMQESEREKAPLSIEPVIRQIAQMYQPILERKNNRMELKIEENLPLVYGISDELIQVLFNLLQNAGKNTEDGSVEISARQVGSEPFVTIAVADTGSGITPEQLPNLFDRRVRFDENGNGLGLPICKEIIDAHGGEIIVESEPGKGTKVSFTVPVAEER